MLGGGKVLIPVFALGRAQELCLLLDAFWERKGALLEKVPIYFSAGLTEKANWYYKMFISWTNQKIKDTFVKRNVFDFKHIAPFDRPPPPSLPYKAGTSRPSLRTDWTRLVPLTGSTAP